MKKSELLPSLFASTSESMGLDEPVFCGVHASNTPCHYFDLQTNGSVRGCTDLYRICLKCPNQTIADQSSCMQDLSGCHIQMPVKRYRANPDPMHRCCHRHSNLCNEFFQYLYQPGLHVQLLRPDFGKGRPIYIQREIIENVQEWFSPGFQDKPYELLLAVQ